MILVNQKSSILILTNKSIYLLDGSTRPIPAYPAGKGLPYTRTPKRSECAFAPSCRAGKPGQFLADIMAPLMPVDPKG